MDYLKMYFRSAMVAAKYTRYYFKMLELQFMDKDAMGRVIIKNNLYVVPFGCITKIRRNMQLKNINDFYIDGLTGIEYETLEECVIAIHVYNRDY